MTRSKATSRRRPESQIGLGRAARLHRLVVLLATAPRTRDRLLADLAIGLRTFYRELERLRRSGIRVQHAKKAYALKSSRDEAEGLLPFPDPKLSFAEMAELARCPGPAGIRLAALLATVVAAPAEPKAAGSKGRKKKAPDVATDPKAVAEPEASSKSKSKRKPK